MPAGPPKSHNRLLLVKRDPERAACAQFYFVFAVKLDERLRSFACSISYASYIGICQANNRIATAIPTSRAIEFQQPLPLFVCHIPLSFRSALRFCLGSPQGTRSLIYISPYTSLEEASAAREQVCSFYAVPIHSAPLTHVELPVSPGGRWPGGSLSRKPA